MKAKLKARILPIVSNKTTRQFGIYLLYLFGGFLLSIGGVVNGLKPFGVSLVAVSKNKGYFFSLLGASIGYLMFGITAEATRYFCSAVAVAIVAFIMDMLRLSHLIAIPLISSGASILLTGVAVNIQMGYESELYLVTIGECILTVGATYFYHKSINASLKKLRLRALPTSELICIIVAISTLFLSLGQLKAWLLYPIRIIAVVMILFIVRFQGERFGVLLSLPLGFVLGASNRDTLFLCGALSLSTLIGSLFTSLASLGIAGGFMGAITFFAIAGGQEAGLSLFLDSGIGTLIFLLTPSALCNKIEDYFESTKDYAPDGTLRQNLVLKLRFASSAMGAISDSVDEVRERISTVNRRNNLAKRDYLSDTDYTTNEIIEERTNQIRMVASDQFHSIAGMLNDLATEFSDAEIFNSSAGTKIRQLLGEYDIYPNNISVIEDKFGRTRVEILLNSSTTGLTNPKLQEEIGKICGRYFDTGRITNFRESTMLSYAERPSYMIEIGFAQHSAEGELCGDTVKIVNDGKGHSILIISDGMGKGSRAALDGAMSAGLLSRLINAGFGFDSALKVVNSALLVKSSDESLATLDIANIDLFTGKCELFKAGASASYIIKNGSITKCELSSMPIGILRGIEFAKRTAVLGVGDSIIMMSDGICDLGDSWIDETLGSIPYDTQECADYIIENALAKMQGKKTDDMSVIIARLERN